MGYGMTHGIVWTLLLAELDADSAVDWLVAGIPGLVALGGVIKCVQIARRNTTSTPCLVGLALVLGSVAMLSLIGLAELAGFEEASLETAAAPAGTLAVVGFIVALIGLIVYRRAKPPHVQASGQAILALVLAVVVLGWRGNVHREAFQSGSLRSSILELAGGGEDHVFEQYNFRFERPNGDWKQLDESAFNSDACLAFRQRRTGVFFFLIAERAGIELALTDDALADVAASHLRAVDGNAQFGKREDIRHAGMQGLVFRSDVNVGLQRLCYDHRVFSHNGFAYQLITGAKQGKRRDVEKGARAMLDCFVQIDRALQIHGDETRIIGKHMSPRLGYEVDLTGEAWFTTDAIERAYEHEDLIAVYRDVCWLSIIAVGLDDETAPDEAVLRGMLALEDYGYPASPVRGRSTANSEGRREIVFHYDFMSEEPTEIRALCRLVRTDGVVYLIQAAYEKSSAAGRAQAEAVVRRVRITAPENPVSEIELLPRETRAQARFYNQIGVHFYDNEAFDRAQRWFADANALDDTKVSYVRNVTLCLMKRNRNAEALRLLNRNLDLIEGDLDLRGDRAYLLAMDGKPGAAQREYGTIFERGLRDDEDLEYYGGLLVDAERVDDAKRLLEDYRREDDSPALVTIHARVLMRAKLLEEAWALLEKQPEPRAAVIRYALIGVLEKLAKHEKALVVAVSLLADGYDSAWTYRAKARQEIALKRYDEAYKTLDLAEAKYGQDEQITKLREAARK